jgi:Arc/MetJ-type ribon-helix-helix transcriptional regulator
MTTFERTTISLTSPQMSGMKKRIEAGDFPDLSEGIRTAVREYLERHGVSVDELPDAGTCVGEKVKV